MSNILKMHNKNMNREERNVFKQKKEFGFLT